MARLILGIAVIFGLALIFSKNRRTIKIRYIIQILIVEFIIAYFLLHSQTGVNIVLGVSDSFNLLLKYAADGTNFVFGGLLNKDASFDFFLNILTPIVFISALIGILQYIKVLPLIIKTIGWVLSKINGMGELESFNAVSALIVGQQENFLTYKNSIKYMSDNRTFTLAATAMSTVSAAILGSYMKIIEPKYVVIAIILNVFSTFIILSLINPYDYKAERSISEIEKESKEDHGSFFEMLSDYILTGFKVAVIIGAMLIGFIALISMINAIFTSIFGISFQGVLGYLFYPIAWIVGVPADQALKAGTLMATKIVTNEFVAMIELTKNTQAWHLTPKTVGIVSIFLVSFANFSSIAIIIGAVQSLNAEKGKIVAKFGVKILYSAVLVSLLSATIAGCFIS
ncbi:MAG: nucleoside transporter C-terminal domain-containing protein [Psittacicella sp.]